MIGDKKVSKSYSQAERLRDIFSTVQEAGLVYTGTLEDIDYYSILCKATANNRLFKMFSCNLCMFAYKYQNEDAVLIIFSVPIAVNQEVTGENKHMSERMVDVLKVIEDCFVTVDYMNSKEVKEDKFVYITIVKKIND